MVKKLKISNEDVRLYAASVARQKGYPYSETDFGCYLVEARRSIQAGGATKKQLAEFERLVSDAPILRGHFNRRGGG